MADKKLTVDNVDELVAQVDTGARSPSGWQAKTFTTIAFLWSVFQLYTASSVPYWLTDLLGINVILNNSEVRLFHLSFALMLAAMAYPLLKTSPRKYIPWYDWVLGLLGVASVMYLLVFKLQIADRAGLPTTTDLFFSALGMIMLGVAVFRSLGLPLIIVAGVFVLYVFFGSSEFLPDVVRWKGASFGKAMWHYWMQTEGVFGVALGVSSSMIFLFVLFGSILEKAGAGNYFIKIAFALIGHLRGGPAKAAVIASAMSGLYSGSSIANTVTTGTFTIPLMKKTGFTPEKAGAVEVASSTNGQLTPPVMGAAAFLISEFTGTPYTDIIRHALIPALVSYIALVYIVHLEALKLDLKGLPKPSTTMTLASRVIGVLSGFIGISFLGIGVYYGLGWIKTVAPDMAFLTVIVLCSVMYLILLYLASRHPDLKVDNPEDPIVELPPAGATAITGLYFLLPIVILIWSIMIERLSPALAAFWATIAMSVVALTQHPIKAFFRGEGEFAARFMRGVHEWFEGMLGGARNMIGIAVATGAAGIIVGTISLTGAHQVVGEFVEFLSGGSLMVMLLLVAVMSLILGMGLPTTANYIVVSSLMAPVIVALGAKSGLIVPLIAVHLFVFYFGILADDTPPVGLAAFAAAAISGGDPIKTGIQGFMYDIRTALLPFMFLFNTELLLIDVSPIKAVFVFIVAVIAMLSFASATQQYMLTRNRIWETVALLLVAFTLFRPGFWLDRIESPYIEKPGAAIFDIVKNGSTDGELRLRIAGPDFNNPDETSSMVIAVPVKDIRLQGDVLDVSGIEVSLDGDTARMEEPLPGSAFEGIGRKFDFYGDDPVQIVQVAWPRERMAKEVFYIPAFILLGLIVLLQRRRRAAMA